MAVSRKTIDKIKNSSSPPKDVQSKKFLVKMRPKMEDNIVKIGHGNGTEAVFLVVCDPSMNEL
jgi:hypothetical protein